jgi:hypothetical protein
MAAGLASLLPDAIAVMQQPAWMWAAFLQAAAPAALQQGSQRV